MNKKWQKPTKIRKKSRKPKFNSQYRWLSNTIGVQSKGAAENEKSILVQVTQARAGIVNAKTPEDLELAGRQINTAINLAFEAYPQIRSTENFQDLQSQLEGTENRINLARTRYNGSVASYNTYVRGYFKKMALNMFGDGEDFSVRNGI